MMWFGVHGDWGGGGHKSQTDLIIPVRTLRPASGLSLRMLAVVIFWPSRNRSEAAWLEIGCFRLFLSPVLFFLSRRICSRAASKPGSLLNSVSWPHCSLWGGSAVGAERETLRPLRCAEDGAQWLIVAARAEGDGGVRRRPVDWPICPTCGAFFSPCAGNAASVPGLVL